MHIILGKSHHCVFTFSFFLQLHMNELIKSTVISPEQTNLIVHFYPGLEDIDCITFLFLPSPPNIPRISTLTPFYRMDTHNLVVVTPDQKNLLIFPLSRFNISRTCPPISLLYHDPMHINYHKLDGKHVFWSGWERMKVSTSFILYYDLHIIAKQHRLKSNNPTQPKLNCFNVKSA